MKLLKYVIPIIFAFFVYTGAAYAQRCNDVVACPGADQLCLGGQCIAQPTGMKPNLYGDGALANTVTQFFLFTIPVAGLIGFLFFLWAGFEFLTSKGDPKMLQAAKQRLTYTIVGLVFIFSAYLITRLIASLFNIAIDF